MPRYLSYIIEMGLISVALGNLNVVTNWATSRGDQEPIGASDYPKPRASTPTWLEKYGKQIDLTFTGPLSFSHLPYTKCLEVEDTSYDIAILGMPFDTGVTHRSGYASPVGLYRVLGAKTWILAS